MTLQDLYDRIKVEEHVEIVAAANHQEIKHAVTRQWYHVDMKHPDIDEDMDRAVKILQTRDYLTTMNDKAIFVWLVRATKDQVKAIWKERNPTGTNPSLDRVLVSGDESGNGKVTDVSTLFRTQNLVSF